MASNALAAERAARESGTAAIAAESEAFLHAPRIAKAGVAE
jgi:hypothetical protein